MAHFNIIEENERKERLLLELYKLIDDYNKFVVQMDKKLDSVLVQMECLHEDSVICGNETI